MSNELPQIYWYVFWLVVLFAYAAFKVYVATIGHRRAMKALDILGAYAEKGAEPPAAVTDQLARQILNPHPNGSASAPEASAPLSRGLLVRMFLGFTFASCVSWALNHWLVS